MTLSSLDAGSDPVFVVINFAQSMMFAHVALKLDLEPAKMLMTPGLGTRKAEVSCNIESH